MEVDESDFNPNAIFVSIILLFTTIALIQYVFVIFSIWFLAFGIFLGLFLLKSFNEIPNLFVLLQVTGTIKASRIENATNKRTSKGCTVCYKKGCSRHKGDEMEFQFSPDKLFIPKDVDNALTEFLEIVLNTNIYSWYRNLSHDQGFVDELRCALRHAASVVYFRLRKMESPRFITKKVLAKLMVHIDSFFFVKERINNKEHLAQAFLDHLKTYTHFCVQNDTAEKEYLRHSIQTLLPYLIPKDLMTCRGLNCYLEELCACVILKPLVENTVDPDFLNNLLLIFLDESVLPEPNYPLSEKVNFLEKFVKNRANYSDSALTIPIYELLHNAQYLYPFMQFMKEGGSLNVLQFCLSVEEFNKRILAAELSKEEEEQILEEVKEINDLYFRQDAIDKIDFPLDLITDFDKCVSSSKVDQAKMSVPIFRAYEFAVDVLEKDFVPSFHQNVAMFTLRSGDRFIKVKKNSVVENNTKRKFMPFAELSKITSKIRAKKLGTRTGEELTFMDELDYPLEEAYEAYDSGDEEENMEDDDEDLDDAEYNVDNFDLNYCHIAIPKMDFIVLNNKRCYVYVVTIEVIGQDSQWQVARKYNEFYVLNNKLRRFHEHLEKVDLPPKRTILKKDFEYLNSIRPKLQEYLQHLARSPHLKESSLLQRFLSPGLEIDGMFEPDSMGREAGRKVKSLRSKLHVEKGQNLSPFLNSFISSAEPAAKKKIPIKPPASQMMYSSHRQGDALTLPPPHWARELRRNLSNPSDTSFTSSITPYILYLCRNIFKVPLWVHHFLIFLQFTCKNTIDAFVEKFISYKMSNAFAERQVVSYIHLVRDVIFFNNDAPRTDSDKAERRDKVLSCLLHHFPGKIRDVIGGENHDHAMQTLLEMFQYPQINKHLFYVLLDELLFELFPEIRNASEERN